MVYTKTVHFSFHEQWGIFTSKNQHAAYSRWLCSKVMHGPYSGCQKVPIYAFGPTLSSCVLAVVARTISRTVEYSTVSTSVRNCHINSCVLKCVLALCSSFCRMKQLNVLLPLLGRMLVQCRVTPQQFLGLCQSV